MNFIQLIGSGTGRRIAINVKKICDITEGSGRENTRVHYQVGSQMKTAIVDESYDTITRLLRDSRKRPSPLE